MKTSIAHVEAIPIRLPFKNPLTYAKGTLEFSNTVLVRLVDEAGREGWGETNDYPFAYGNDQRMIFSKLSDHILPSVIGLEPQQIGVIHRAMNAAFRLDTLAKSAVDMAAYDLAGKQRELPVHALLGGQRVDTVPNTGAILFGSPEENAEAAREYVKDGYHTIKLKIGGNPHSDVLRTRAVSEVTGKTVRLRVDVNAAYDRPTALRVVHQLADLDIEYIEQPLRNEDVAGMTWLSQHSPVPVAADDALETLADAYQFCANNACSTMVLKLIKCGGLYELQKIASLAEAAGVGCTLGSGMDTSIASSAVLHAFAASDGISGGAEVTAGYYADDVVTKPIVNKAEIPVPTQPGLGVEIDPQKLARYRCDR